MSLPQQELTIVGAGPVGSLAALLAAQAGFSVLLMDAAAEPLNAAPAGAYDLRVVALSPSSRALFEQVQAWPEALARRAQAYQAMQVWDADGAGQISFSAAQLAVPELGHIVEVPGLQAALDQAIGACAGQIERWQGAQFARFEIHPQGLRLHCRDGRSAVTQLLVGADGRSSRVRQRAGIGVEFRDYQQQGIVAVLEPEQAHQSVARQAFTSRGPLGLLPLANGQVSIVWSVADAVATELLHCAEADFCTAVARACGQSGFRLVSRRAAFPLVLQHANSYAADAIALIGDAAHAVHPLAGLGMNLGFEDAAALFGAPALRWRQGPRRAVEPWLRQYARGRRRSVLPAIAMMDALNLLFGSRSGEVLRLRDWGLNLVDRQTRIKQEFMAYALGSGALPHGEREMKTV